MHKTFIASKTPNLTPFSGTLANIMKILHRLLFLLILSSCCQDEVVYSNKITEFEKSLIPYLSFDNDFYSDQNGNSIRASFDPREFKTSTERPGPESCQLDEYQNLTGSFRFISLDLELTLTLSTFFERRQFKVNEYYYGDENLGIDLFQDCNNDYLNEPFENRIKNIELLDFQFTNVIVIEDCSIESQLDKIIVSPEKGIDFILFKDNSYLKLIK